MAKPQHQGPPSKSQGQHPNMNPLDPMTPKQIRHQAASTLRAIYKPAFKQLGREQKRTLSISEKRKADNAYYLNWLNTQSDQLQAHQDAANAALISAGSQAQQEIDKGYSDLHSQLVASGESTPGVVSNPGDANAFDVSAEAAHSRELVGAERARTQDQIARSGDAGALAKANNFALIAAAEANRTADTWKKLSELGDAKQQLRLTKAADTAKEVARLFDREIQKSQIKGEQHSDAVNAALAAAKFGLDKSKFGLDVSEFEQSKKESGRKFRLEKGKAHETARHHHVEETLEAAKTHEEKLKQSHKMTGVITEGYSYVANHPKLSSKVAKDPQAVIRSLTKILGSSIAAHAAVELFTRGTFTSTTRSDLKGLGYIIPPKWR